MNIRTLFPCVIVFSACFLPVTGALAQSSEADPRSASTTIKPNGATEFENEPVAATPVEESRPRSVVSGTASRVALVAPAINLTNRTDQLLLAAMLSHLGASYHFNRTGPEEFDCSGFVWRAFQDIGLNFQRGPARSYWATFEAPPANEQFKFGTLVFFSNLSHVGIVVDEKGFYHSARHGGVMYSPFNDYWLSRIDGFRRVPLTLPETTTAKTKPQAAKPTVVTLEQNNEP